jgi:sugar phosphate permease
MNSLLLDSDAERRADSAAYRKVTRRLIPFLIFCYMLAFIDRINIGFAQLQMKHDLSLSDTAYGLASSAFFIGYLLFEVPSNLLLQKIGARKTLCRIMLCWGVISASTMFVHTPAQFLFVRFLLGVFEAGFAPGILLYLTYWYPPERQGRAVGMFTTGTLIAGLIAGPISSSILVPLDGVYGLRGWQWLFLLEGLPSTLVGIAAFFYITDRPADAAWLSAGEKAVIERNNSASLEKRSEARSATRWYTVFRDPRAFILAFCLFTAQAGSYVIFFWMPQILKGFREVTISQVGFYTMIPYLAAMVTMILWGKRSDSKLERRWHFAIALFCAAGGFLMIVANPGSLAFTMIAFTISISAILASIPVFWGAVFSALSPAARVAGIALIASLGSLGGLFSPTLIGFVRDTTGKADLGLYIVTALMTCGGAAMLWLLRTRRDGAAIQALT